MQIKTLFDPSKDIYRNIEKVITYNASQEVRLKAEITEYIVTESIEDQFERLLTKMQQAMDSGGENEVGVWVSGFYGSGKSSFTKYLGLALDQSVQIEGTRFLKYLQDRMNKPQTRALLSTVAIGFLQRLFFSIWQVKCWPAQRWRKSQPFCIIKFCSGLAIREI